MCAVQALSETTPADPHCRRTGYDALLRDRLAYSTPEMVAERLAQLRDELGLFGVIIEPNVGGDIPRELVFQSVRLFAQEVVPRLR